MVSFCLHKNIKHGGVFVQDYSKIILRRLDPKRYGMSSVPTELQTSTIDFLLLMSVAAEFCLGLFSTSLSGALTSNFTAILGQLFTGVRKWPRELPFTHRRHRDEATTAKRASKGAWYRACGTTHTLLQKQGQMLFMNEPNWAAWTPLVATTLSAIPVKQKPACFLSPLWCLSSRH